MAAQSSLYKEDRNLLRMRERERRNQEALQDREKFPRKTPLFAEPYKTQKGDELSSRIQSMLGNYEEVKEFISNRSHQDFIGIPTVLAPPLPQQGRPAGSGRGRGRESRACLRAKRSAGRAGGEAPARQLQASLLALSPLLSALASPLAPLSPLHSGQQPGGRSRGLPYGRAEASRDLGAEERESREGAALPPAGAPQAFPQPLPCKSAAMQQKPTAYVRPMDGQDQAPVESPELKPLLEEYPGEPYGRISDLKAAAKARLSKLEIPSEPLEQTFPADVHSIEDILKEMTHSWPPPLTAIHTPSTAEPSKFPFPAKEPQHSAAAAHSQKQYEAAARPLPAPQPPTSMLQEDLHLSDSEESSDDQVVDQPPPELPPPGYRALQCQPSSVASAHSSSLESGSSSGSDSSSDSETESSDSEASDPPLPAPQPDPPACNKWQLDNWLSKVNPAAVPTESLSQSSPGDGAEEDKEQEQGSSLQPPGPQLQGCSQAAPQDAPLPKLPTQPSCQQAPGHPQEPLPRHTVGIKRPSKAPVHEEPKGGLKVESEPGPGEGREQPCRDKPKVKTKGKAKARDRRDPKPALPQPPEKRKHRSCPQAGAKPFLEPQPSRDLLLGSAQEPLALSPLPGGRGTTPTRTGSHRPPPGAREDGHKEQLPLPGQEDRLGSPGRDSPSPLSLLVKIHLPLLARVPQPSGQGSHQSRAEAKELPGARKQHMERKATEPSDKPKRKRKMEEEVERKKAKSERKSRALLPQKASSKLKTPKAPCEAQQQDLLPPTALPAKSPAHPAPRVAPKRPLGEGSELPGTDSTARSSHRDPWSSKHRKVERNQPELSRGIQGPAGAVCQPCPVPSLPNGACKPRRPQLQPQQKHPVEHYREEAKRLKHKADAMTDKAGKAIQYLDAALAFIEYGLALELDAPAPRSASSIFRDTIDLIQFISTGRAFPGSSAACHEEIFLVLCARCQALLHMALFQPQREAALSYCRLLGDLLKSSARAAPAASPGVPRSTGLPSPLSPLPSPGAGSSQAGASSSGSSSSVPVPSCMPSITSSYIGITTSILQAHELWEQAEALASRSKEFFAELSTATGPLALSSSLGELLHYTRQGLHWLRMETHSP
ncbi:AF4/FMR2 family member 1 [Dryobates pubescens]|uniref:AF4/FMR2 family member 1 n=1 Tax=Dryobates pubescens TaxID=118200 RepID=UPI0023B8ED44|nr:AF4/FMR2 family member 1 [Dryobates pubescens]